jgi:hypothetical protein
MARAGDLEEIFSDRHRAYGPDDAHWYLSELTVEPESQEIVTGRKRWQRSFDLRADMNERYIWSAAPTSQISSPSLASRFSVLKMY